MAHAGGAPTIINPGLQAKFCEHVRAGNYIDTVCTALMIDESTYTKWKQKAEVVNSYLIANNINGLIVDITDLPDEIVTKWVYWQFIRSVKQAEADYEIEAISNIRNAPKFDKNWVAEMTVLSRRIRKHWQETQGVDQETLKLGLSVFDRLLKALERPAAGPGPELQTTVKDVPLIETNKSLIE